MAPIEKAFAIKAEPAVIWDALWADLTEGADGSFEVQESHRPNLLSIRLQLGGLPSRLTYRLDAKDSHTEVSLTLEPLGLRYVLYQLVTFGQSRRNYELVLVQGLANLKEAVEHGVEVAQTEDGETPATDDEDV